jgi:16S rRNA C1402 N4-methylase RsmH
VRASPDESDLRAGRTHGDPRLRVVPDQETHPRRGQPETRDDHRPADLRHAVAEPLVRKAVVASAAEIAANPRSRSARLRALRKL